MDVSQEPDAGGRLFPVDWRGWLMGTWPPPVALEDSAGYRIGLRLAQERERRVLEAILGKDHATKTND